MKTLKTLLLPGMGIDLRKLLDIIVPLNGMRSRHYHSLDGQRGLSVVELLIVIIIIAIVCAFALMQRGSANEQFQRKNIARELKIAFERARFDSVKRRAVGGAPQAYVTVTPASFTLRTYNTDVNGTSVANDLVTSVPSGVVIAHYDGSALVSHEVDFNMRGETPTSPAPQFYICNISCSSPTNSTANIVLVTPTGTVNLLTGGASIPTFTSPTVSNVSGATGINPIVVAP